MRHRRFAVGALAIAGAVGIAVASDRLPEPSNAPSSAASGASAPTSAPSCEIANSLANFISLNPNLAQTPSGSKSLCGAWNLVLQRLIGTTATGGRRLEGDRPLDPAAVARDNAEALADPEYLKDLDRLVQGETDALRRKALTAALLQEAGYFSASQALMDEIKPTLKR